ncbi:MAG: hypothetical protein LQ351_004901 [Letrouitia transgressa]|nr:MAG: hypothetical protein LQ351_004901 [Letrouitia transgressa]
MTVVLANGSTVFVSKTSYPDLFWGMLGAGQNFGIVTEANIKIYDSPSAWFYAEMQFTQEKLEAFFNRLSMVTKNGTQPKELGSIYSYFTLNRKISVSDVKLLCVLEQPVILMQFAYAGTEAQAWPYLRPFLSLNPTTFKKNTTLPPSNIQSAASQDSDSALCADGLSNFLLFPLGLQVYNTTANRAVYNLFKNFVTEYPAFDQTIVQFEDYALEGMKKIDPASTAYPHRDDNILVSFAPVYKFAPELDSLAFKIANQARDIWHAGDAPWRKRTAYLNYAAGDETAEQLYGYESWRLERLRALKKKYDPNGKLVFFNPFN